jgi:hypothetical protein
MTQEEKTQLENESPYYLNPFEAEARPNVI